MAIDLNNWVPKYVKQVLGYSSGQSIKAARWNELWNLSIEQGDYNSETLDLLIDLVNTKSDDEEVKEILDTKADQAWVVSQLALKTDVSVFDAFRNQQNSTNQTVQTALNNRYTKAETDERLNLKFDKTDAQPLLKEVTFDAQTGVFTITRQNGTTFQINTLLEKVPVQFLLEDNKLILIAEDGTRQEADLSAFIDVYTFQDSVTVQFVQTMSTNHTVTASVKDKSIGFEQLKDNVYQTISDDRAAAEAAAESALASKTAAENAAAQATTKASEASQSAATALESKNTAVASAESASVSEQSAERDALMAQSYAVGGTGLRPGEDTDNAKYYSQQAGEIVGGDFATKTELQQHEEYAEETYAKKDDVPQGVIKADGTTVTSAMIPFAQGAKNTSGALGEAQFRNVYFGDTELVEGKSELPEGTLYITPDVDGGGSSLPSGGTPGQILTKTAEGAEWADAPSGSDPDAIKKDGTTVTTGTIPFKLGIITPSISSPGPNTEELNLNARAITIRTLQGFTLSLNNQGPGEAGQVLTAKGDGTCGWADAARGLPAGGANGQILSITDDTGTVGWINPEQAAGAPSIITTFGSGNRFFYVMTTPSQGALKYTTVDVYTMNKITINSSYSISENIPSAVRPTESETYYSSVRSTDNTEIPAFMAGAIMNIDTSKHGKIIPAGTHVMSYMRKAQ